MKEFRMPELAESVVEGEIIRWLVQVGEFVAEEAPLVEVMTDKATVEITSPFSGTLTEQVHAEGDVVPVGEVIARFDVSSEQAGTPEPAAEAPDTAEDTAEDTGDDTGDELSLFKARGETGSASYQISRPTASAPASTPAPVQQTTDAFGRILAVPAARKLARERGIDLAAVQGSGPNGRIRVADVEQHHGAAYHAPRPSFPTDLRALETRTPVRGLRRVIAKSLTESHLETVRTLHVDEADVTGLVNVREVLKPLAAARGVRLSYLPFFMKAVAQALQEFPMINASLDTETNEIIEKRYYNLGMAVATDNGLVVPVVKHVDQQNVIEIGREVQRLAAAARDGSLTPEDFQDGTFSLTNIGSLGGLFSFPIINLPEAAILGVHSIKKRPVVLADDSIVARSMIYLSLSFDHRIVDGAEGAMFTSRVIELIQEPEQLILDL